MADFLMPALGADMEQGTVVQWNVQPGSRVRPGDVVAVVETHKGAIDVEIFLEGVIEDLVPVGTQLPVGGVLARVRQPGEAAAPTPPPAAPKTVAPLPAPAAPVPPRPVVGTRGKASPAARQLAAARGIDLSTLSGTGVEGSITVADVERAAGQRMPAPMPAPARSGFDPAQMRAAIAASMSRSKREIPHYYLGSTIDFGPAQQWLAHYNADRPPAERLLAAVLLVKAVARALTEVPQFNGFYENGAARAGPGIHIGWAISLRGGGLVAPALHDADRKPMAELMSALRDLVQRARSGGLRSSELTDPTITVTSLGERGADRVQGVIYPPQLAIVGFGRVAERPWVVDGAVQARPLIEASLAADHRATDGHLGGQFLAAIDEALQHPERL